MPRRRFIRSKRKGRKEGREGGWLAGCFRRQSVPLITELLIRNQRMEMESGKNGGRKGGRARAGALSLGSSLEKGHKESECKAYSVQYNKSRVRRTTKLGKYQISSTNTL